MDFFIIISSTTTTNNKKVTQAGWGLWVTYDHPDNIDDATISSCMTSELGDLKHRVEFCDLKDLVSEILNIDYTSSNRK